MIIRPTGNGVDLSWKDLLLIFGIPIAVLIIGIILACVNEESKEQESIAIDKFYSRHPEFIKHE